MNQSMALARAVVETLVARGISEVVLAPGSRSGPLALVLHEADRRGLLRLHVRVDERTAGFLALGMAKASRRTVPVVTTSGTAVANLHPAVLEARHAGVRLLVISADRPTRLRGTGANQTTNQINIFGDLNFGTLTAASDAAAQITGLLDSSGHGPAHLNVEFDEPLISHEEAHLTSWPRADPHESGYEPAVREDGEVAVIATDRPTVVVAGDDARQSARQLAVAANWPLLAEPSSGSRTGGNALAAYRLLLQHSPLAGRIERVIVFGHPTLSRPVTALLARSELEIVVVGADLSGFPHPGTHVRQVRSATVEAPGSAEWLEAWLEQGRIADTEVAALVAASPLTGYSIASQVWAAVRPGGLLYVGSSNSIRDLDLVGVPAPVGEKRLTLANRGLSGIDGTLSSAIGAALARPSTSAHAYVGDLTFLHDVNGLLIGPDEPRPDLTIVVASDDGGSIFSTLEQGAPAYAAAFERVYATPTGADLGALCRAYSIPHVAVATQPALAAALQEPSRGLRVIEAKIDRSHRREFAARLDVAVRAAIN